MKNPSIVNDIKTHLLFLICFHKSKECIKIRVTDSKKGPSVFNYLIQKYLFFLFRIIRGRGKSSEVGRKESLPSEAYCIPGEKSHVHQDIL